MLCYLRGTLRVIPIAPVTYGDLLGRRGRYVEDVLLCLEELSTYQFVDPEKKSRGGPDVDLYSPKVAQGRYTKP